MFNHVRGLLELGHTVEAWCPPTADRAFAPLVSMITEHVVPLAMPVVSRLSEKLQFRLRVERELAAMEAHCRLCAAEIDAGGFDVVFANTCAFFRMTPITRFTRLPSVLYLQEPYRWLFEALPRLMGRQAVYRRRSAPPVPLARLLSGLEGHPQRPRPGTA